MWRRLVQQRLRHFTSASTGSFRKPIISPEQAIGDIKSGSTIIAGGFGLCGIPEKLIQALDARSDVNELTIVSNDAGVDHQGLGLLISSGKVCKMISSYIGENHLLQKLYLNGKVAVELTPQGTLAERLRAGGAGIPAFYTRTGMGTEVESGDLILSYPQGSEAKPIKSSPREVRHFDNVAYLMERAIRGDYGLIKAWRADEYGNLIFHKSARNFNPLVAKAASKTIVEVEEIVPVGALGPESIHLPGIYVDQLVLGVNYEKPIERLTTIDMDKAKNGIDSARERIVQRAAKEFRHGMYVNLGIGMPMLASNYIPEGMIVHVQSENGILGMGPFPPAFEVDPDLINAGKETVTVLPGASYFSSDDSFAMIRGGHIHLSILGAMQVSQYGDLANWIVPGKRVMGMGGAMDLAASGARIVVTTYHRTRSGEPKILPRCTFPVTELACVHRIITEMAVFDVDRERGLTLIELAEDVTMERVKEATGCPFSVADQIHRY